MTYQGIDLSALPPRVATPVAAWLEHHASGPIAEALAGGLVRPAELVHVLGCSAFVGEIIGRYPELLGELAHSGRLARPLESRELESVFVQACDDAPAEAEFESRLRRLRHRELVRIAWRDLGGQAGLGETLRELSALADAAIRASLDWARDSLRQRYGIPRTEAGEEAELGVLAMGKLGGRELNFSSDVDLVFVYTDAGATDGPRPASNEEYFRLLAQRLVSLLSRRTGDGFVYRVDVRLRPFGDSGPLALSLPALETYLMRHGRDWERYAYVKARVVNDWRATPSLYDDVLRPFVYRRYLDYGVFDSLREMKALIEAEVTRKEYAENLKLGPGGIREIEFIAQSLQLVRGGTIEDLRQRELQRVLVELVRHDCLPQAVAQELDAAYVYLRQLENRLQAIADRQTHDLPKQPLNRARLALAMGDADFAALRSSLQAHRQRVAGHFRQIVFRATGGADTETVQPELATAWAAGSSADVLGPLLAAAGFADPDAAAERLQGLRRSSTYRRIDEQGRQRLAALIPAVIGAAAEQADPALSLDATLRVIEAIGRRSAYFSLLNENPLALERLVRLCAMSEFLVRQVAKHPLLLDELLDQRVFEVPPSRDDLKADLELRLEGIGDGDTEAWLNELRNFQQASTFHVAVADLSGALPLMKVSDRLTDIAELVLQTALDFAWAELAARHGAPVCVDGGEQRSAEFCIVAYGKLGGLELGYGSDLDVVFLHDSEGEQQRTDGDHPLENAVFFARLTRRVINILTMPTTTGPLYEVDTRLRPSGRSGLLVSSLTAFERYQREDAWTWEHQALLRSRAVAGSARVMAAFEVLRARSLTNYVRRDELASAVAEMRARMRDELCQGTPDLFDIKQDRGGIADIEFIVQYLVLREAARDESLFRYSDNIRQLEALAESRLLPGDDAELLATTYRDYRRRMHHLALADSPALIPRTGIADASERVCAIWDRVFAA